MHPKGHATAPLLVALVLFAGLLAGCGGGDQSGDGGSQDGAGGGNGEAAGNPDAPESKVAIGEVVSVKPDKEKIVLRQTGVESQDGGRITFKVKKKADITLAGKEAELADAKGGQQAQVEYTVSDKQNNQATEVQLFEGGGGSG